jgi:hypothetical protein
MDEEYTSTILRSNKMVVESAEMTLRFPASGSERAVRYSVSKDAIDKLSHINGCPVELFSTFDQHNIEVAASGEEDEVLNIRFSQKYLDTVDHWYVSWDSSRFVHLFKYPYSSIVGWLCKFFYSATERWAVVPPTIVAHIVNVKYNTPN